MDAIYATLQDVQNRMPQFILTDTSKPTCATAEELLMNVSAQFDGVLASLGYCVPLTGPKSLAQGKEIVCQGAIAQILYARAAAIGTDAAIQSADRAWKMYQESIMRLADDHNPMDLSDACVQPDAGGKPGRPLMGLTTDACGYGLEPRITMSSKF